MHMLDKKSKKSYANMYMYSAGKSRCIPIILLPFGRKKNISVLFVKTTNTNVFLDCALVGANSIWIMVVGQQSLSFSLLESFLNFAIKAHWGRIYSFSDPSSAHELNLRFSNDF